MPTRPGENECPHLSYLENTIAQVLDVIEWADDIAWGTDDPEIVKKALAIKNKAKDMQQRFIDYRPRLVALKTAARKRKENENA